MPGVVPSWLPAAAPALPVADVRTRVHGNDDGPSDKGEVRTVDISPETDWNPPPDLPDVFRELAGYRRMLGPTTSALVPRSSRLLSVGQLQLPASALLNATLASIPLLKSSRRSANLLWTLALRASRLPLLTPFLTPLLTFKSS